MTGCAPDYLSEQFVKLGVISQRTTRSSQKLNIPLFKSATGQRTFYYRTVSLWNSLDSKFKLCPNVTSFKRNLRNKLLSGYLDTSFVIIFEKLLCGKDNK